MRLHLSAHPFQRVGAFALAHLGRPDADPAKLPHPTQLTPQDLHRANETMIEDLKRSCHAESAQSPDGFWTRVSYMFWPNCPIGTSHRAKMSVTERQGELIRWRTIPEPDWELDLPCMLCPQSACGLYGKVDVVLTAPSSNLNNGPTPGLPLCRPCLLSFYALPYGCDLNHGRPSLLHTWDDDLLAAAVATRFHGVREAELDHPEDGEVNRWHRYAQAIDDLRSHPDPPDSQIQVLIFQNGNKEAVLTEENLDPDLATWVYQLPSEHLYSLHALVDNKKIAGEDLLPRILFTEPDTLQRRIRDHLQHTLLFPGTVIPHLADLHTSYLETVKHMKTSEKRQMQDLARNLSAILESRSDVQGFLRANRRIPELISWLNRKAQDRLLLTTEPEPLITPQQWDLLFNDERNSYSLRQALHIQVLHHLHEADLPWRKEKLSKAEQEQIAQDITDDEDEN